MQRYRNYLKTHNPSELHKIEANERRRQYNSYTSARDVQKKEEVEEEKEEEERRYVGLGLCMGLIGF